MWHFLCWKIKGVKTAFFQFHAISDGAWQYNMLLACVCTTGVVQTCVCRRYKSTGTGLNNNCALITHWSFHWVTAEGDSTDSRDLLNRQRASWFSANYLILAWDQVWIADQQSHKIYHAPPPLLMWSFMLFFCIPLAFFKKLKKTPLWIISS